MLSWFVSLGALALLAVGCHESTLQATPGALSGEDVGGASDVGASPGDVGVVPDASPGADASPGEDASSGEDAPSGEDAGGAEDAALEEDAGPPVYSGSRSGIFTKEGCGVGCAGQQVRYTATQTSLVGVEDAERLAFLDVLASGQAYANAQGGCECAPVACGCENLQNHGSGLPHLYSSAYAGALVGEVVAECPPLYWIEGLMEQPAPMTFVGSIPGSAKKAYRYKHLDDGTPRNTHLRSVGEGCQDYPDVRTQQVNPATYAEWWELPPLSPLESPSTSWLPLFFSTELESQDPGSAVVWSLVTPQTLPSLRFRVNGGEWRSFYEVAWPWFHYLPPATFMETGSFNPPKDFILDVSADEGATAQRFTVFRTSQGGHYSVISTMTRQDGQVMVTCQLSSAELPQRLIDPQTGRVYPSYPGYNHIFELGQLPEVDRVLTLWSAEDVLIDDHILIRVRRTP